MRLRKSTLTSVLATASAAAMASAALGAPAYAAAGSSTTAAPPSSTCTYVDGTVCFWETIWFTGQQVQYTAPLSTGCVNSPIEIRAHVNLTDRNLLLYPGANCTGSATFVPVSDLHSNNTTIRSFRVA